MPIRKRLADLGDDLVVEAVERHVDVARGAQGLPAAAGLAVAHTEDRHQAVAQVLVDLAAVRCAIASPTTAKSRLRMNTTSKGRRASRDRREATRVEKQHH